MSARCPEGHLSESLDYCDVCGTPMGAAPETAASAGGLAGGLRSSSPEGGPAAPGLPEPASEPQAATQTCPHCGALNVADALFCESCGYDFTTGTPPMDAEPEPSPQAVPEPDPSPGSADASDVGGDTVEDGAGDPPAPGGTAAEREEEEGVPETVSDGAPDESNSDPEPKPEPEPEPEPVEHLPEAEAGQGDAPETGPEAAADPGESPASAEPVPDATPVVTAHRKARHTPPSRKLAEAWVVELWVDPDWYAVQQTEEACPSAGVPDIVLLTRSTALVGRPSGSLGVRPEVDAGADSAVSRRHAQLTSDGQRWWVEDLGSSNGTFVGTVGEPMPTEPIPPGQRVEIDRDDRLYVGAWTRLVLRQATASEQQGTG